MANAYKKQLADLMYEGYVFSYERQITDERVTGFAEITGDTNSIHLSDFEAELTIFGRRVAHGMLTGSFISAALGTVLAPEHWYVLYLSQSLNWSQPVFIGDTITAVCTITEWDGKRGIAKLDTRCANQLGAEVLTGEAKIMVKAKDFPSELARPRI